jgi:hypothetical protein
LLYVTYKEKSDLVLILLPQEQKKREDFERKWVESKRNDKGGSCRREEGTQRLAELSKEEWEISTGQDLILLARTIVTHTTDIS